MGLRIVIALLLCRAVFLAGAPQPTLTVTVSVLDRENHAVPGVRVELTADVVSFADTDPGVPKRTLAQGLHGFDRGPPHERVALLGDAASVDLRVGLAMLGGHAGPGTQLLRSGEAGHVADLSHEDRGEDRADTVDSLDAMAACVATLETT